MRWCRCYEGPQDNACNWQRTGWYRDKGLCSLAKTQAQDNRLPPRTLIMDFTMTHVRFGRSHLHPFGQLTHTRRSDGAPDPDGALKEAARIKIRHYRNLFLNRPNTIAPFHLGVDTSVRLYDDFIRLLFLHAHREASALAMNCRRNRIRFDSFGLLV